MAKIVRQGCNAAVLGFCLVAVLAVAAPAQAVPASKAPVYAIDDYPFQKAPALMRWRSVQQREAQLMSRADPDACENGEPRIDCAAKESLLLEEKLKDKAPAEQVEAVYAYFNAVKYQEHAPNCGIDCWKTRIEFLADREGDCGDHALAEYFTLKRLGFKERDMQLIVAQLPGLADSFKGGHVVLRVRAEGEYFILDNRRTELADLSGLRRYKVLAGMNADSVQIYNLVTPSPPPGYVSDATQVAALVTPPGAAQIAESVQVAEATESEPTVPTPQPTTFATQTQPTLVASVADTAPEPETAAESNTAAASATFDDDSETACMQAASLADWNPFQPCTPTKAYKMIVKPKIIIGAEPPKPAEAQTQKPVEVAEALKAPEPKVVATPAPKAAEPKAAAPKPAAKPAVVKPAPKPEPVEATTEETAAEEDSGSCTQGATLADWNPDLPCASDGNSSTLRIEVKE
jgi:predicted transglutaminase-like cysteine proteinase